MVFWLNGGFRDDADAINIAERGFLLGDGVFETLLVRNGVPAFLDEHLARLCKGLAALKIDVGIQSGVGLDGFEAAIHTLIAKCGYEKTTASVRITIARGTGGRGLQFPAPGESAATILMTASAAPQIDCQSGGGVILKLSRFRRPENSITARHKTLNYLDNVLARDEALGDGADDAIMLNSRDRIACASAANIFIIDEEADAVLTPPLGDGALPGIVRGLLLGSGAQTGVEIREAPIEPAVLENRHVFLTNSLIGVRAAVAPGGDQAWPAAPAQMLRRLQTWYDDRLRNDLAVRARKL
jgi:branched-subunit amino acid aminotransferase/4-amino-4-deoxychorismate lyase